MVDPLTALSIASTAVGQIRSLINAGQDATSALSKFAGAVSDINYAAEKAKNPSVWKTLTGSAEAEAIEIFAAQKKTQQLKKDLETLLMFSYGTKGLEEYKNTLRRVRKQRQETAYRKAELKESILTGILGSLVVLAGLAGLGAMFWWLGTTQGKW